MGYEEYIWGDNEGYKFRTFNRLNFSFEFVQTWRDFSSLVAFVMLIITYSVNGTFNLVFLTNWGLHFAFFSLVLNYQASNDQKQYPDKVTGLMFYKWRLAVLLFEVSVWIQVVITILFWSLLWKSPKEYTFKEYFGILKHSLPWAFMLIEFLMQKWVFKIERIWIVIVTATLYMLVNFTYVKMTGFPIYPILPWNNIASVILKLLLANLWSDNKHSILFLWIQQLVNIVIRHSPTQ